MNYAKMSPSKAKELTGSVTEALDSNDLGRHVKRIWVYQQRSLVVDFAYQRVHFGVDFSLLPEGGLAVDLVQRGKSQVFSVTESGEKKDRLASDASADEAIATVVARLRDLTARIDAHRADNTDSGPVPEAETEPVRRRKVGILTLPLSKNYGGNLQAYALMQAVQDLGCDPVLINRRYVIQNPARRVPQEGMAPITNRIDLETDCENRSFIESNILPITRSFRNSAQLRKHLADYDLDAVVAGSDQVWRPKYARGLLMDFFHGYLDGENRSIRRISYAASFGADSWEFSDEQTRKAAELISRFDAVSVREDSAVDLCREHLGADASHVLDPTLLLTPERYRQLFADRLSDAAGRRITSYVLDPNPEKLRLMDAISDRLSMPILSTGAASRDTSVEGWLAAFYQADFVFTDSFHGVAFSILFNRPFIAFANPQRGMARFTSILKMAGLEDRLVIDAEAADLEQLLQPIDWDGVNQRIETLRAHSRQFLLDALGLTADAGQAVRVSGRKKRSDSSGLPVKSNSAPVAVDDGFIKGARDLALYDSERFSAAYMNGDPVGQARARLMFHAHALEKGLSHSKFRPGFGKKPMGRVARDTRKWLESGKSIDDPFFKAAISAAHVYFDRHERLDFDVSHFWDMFSPRVQELITQADDQHGGALKSRMDREAVPVAGGDKSFMDVVYGRRSVREYTPEPINLDQVRQAVQIASQAPSVCNRQGPRVHYFCDPTQIEKLVNLQGGFGGYPKPPGLLLVTCDLTAFVFSMERNQGFIDGGLFMMALLLGLEQVGLGACPLNAAMGSQRETTIRRILKIPESEALISFIAIGNYDPSVLVARSLRYPVEDLLAVHEQGGN